jgi:hypothetical protein
MFLALTPLPLQFAMALSTLPVGQTPALPQGHQGLEQFQTAPVSLDDLCPTPDDNDGD